LQLRGPLGEEYQYRQLIIVDMIHFANVIAVGFIDDYLALWKTDDEELFVVVCTSLFVNVITVTYIVMKLPTVLGLWDHAVEFWAKLEKNPESSLNQKV